MIQITDNLFLFSTLLLSLCSWFIAFVGACVSRRLLSGGSWWIIVYELLIIGLIIITILCNTYTHYRTVILIFLGISISLLTIQLDTLLQKDTRPYRGAANAYVAGYIILIVIQFLWVILFGSEPESYFNHYAPKHVNNSVGVIPHEEDKSSFRPPTTIPMSPTADIDIPTPVHYNEKVQALHAYEANPEDPSELSFAKGEIMDIMDRNGNWWQARKSDGSVGIIPSNYFASPQ